MIKKRPVPVKRPDRPAFTPTEWRWFTTTFKALTRKQQVALGLMVEAYAI